ncbi:hypothetical protein [Rhizorhabdus wittichii]|uniref:hypothetical protein n=1 Tax=Rhizorhabdus wittichii TaxID=160791 RepID=UPI001D025514|nr:hypothetical protein [Rhizorhabdus wittichii]
MGAEDMVGMVEEILVDPQRTAAFIAAGNVGEVEPVEPGADRVALMLLEEQDVDDDVCARLVAHGFAGKANRAEEIGHPIDMLACRWIALVERVSRGDEHGDTACAQLLDRPGDEVIVEREPHPAERRAVLHGDVRKGRIADREIEVAWQ